MPRPAPPASAARTSRTPTSHFQEQGWLRQGWLQAAPDRRRLAVHPAGRPPAPPRRRRRRWPPTPPLPEWLSKSQRIAERLDRPLRLHPHRPELRRCACRRGQTPRVNVTGFALWPTSGGFEISAGRGMDVNLAGLSATVKDHPGVGSSAPRRGGSGSTTTTAGPRRRRRRRPRQPSTCPRAPGRSARSSTSTRSAPRRAARRADRSRQARDALLPWVAGQVGDWQSLAQERVGGRGRGRLSAPPSVLRGTPWLRARLLQELGRR